MAFVGYVQRVLVIKVRNNTNTVINNIKFSFPDE